MTFENFCLKWLEPSWEFIGKGFSVVITLGSNHSHALLTASFEDERKPKEVMTIPKDGEQGGFHPEVFAHVDEMLIKYYEEN